MPIVAVVAVDVPLTATDVAGLEAEAAVLAVAAVAAEDAEVLAACVDVPATDALAADVAADAVVGALAVGALCCEQAETIVLTAVMVESRKNAARLTRYCTGTSPFPGADDEMEGCCCHFCIRRACCQEGTSGDSEDCACQPKVRCILAQLSADWMWT